MITWRYNQWGNVEIWRGQIDLQQVASPPKADLYLQSEIDVKAFLTKIGLTSEEIKQLTPGQWGHSEEPDYFIYDPQNDDDD